MILDGPTFKQLDCVATLKKRHRITDAGLDAYCLDRHDVPFPDLNKWQVSALIEDMKAWDQPPAIIRRAMGQLDLFGNEVAS